MTETVKSQSSGSVLLRVAIAAVLGGLLGAAGAWLESVTGTFWAALALLPVFFALELLAEVGVAALGPHSRAARYLAGGVLVACYIGSWVALRS